jgi:hypothetical protein
MGLVAEIQAMIDLEKAAEAGRKRRAVGDDLYRAFCHVKSGLTQGLEADLLTPEQAAALEDVAEALSAFDFFWVENPAPIPLEVVFPEAENRIEGESFPQGNDEDPEVTHG